MNLIDLWDETEQSMGVSNRLAEQSIDAMDKTEKWDRVIDRWNRSIGLGETNGTEQSIIAMNKTEQSIASDYEFEAINRIWLWTKLIYEMSNGLTEMTE